MPCAPPWLCRRKRRTGDTRRPGTANLISPIGASVLLGFSGFNIQPYCIPTPRQAVPNTHNVMSRASIDIVDQIESERFKPTASLDPRSVHLDHSSLPCRSLRCSSTPEDKQDHQPPLGVELTGYRLLTLVVILTFGIPKAISSYRGQAVSTTLDWVSGTLLAAV